MRLFSIIIYMIATVCIITGGKDFLGGIAGLTGIGEGVSATALADPAMNNAFQFFAGIWIGVGILLIFFLRDLERYKPAMLLLFGIIFLGGIGRLIALLNFGMPATEGATVITIGLIIELGLMPILAGWLAYRFKK